MSENLKLCPNCGADVEGLILYCDCCGELLDQKESLFSYMVYEAGPYFDIMLYLRKIFDRLADVPTDPYADYIQEIDFDFWCYPIKKKTGPVYYHSRKKAIVTVQVDSNTYLYGTKAEKLAYLIHTVQENMDTLSCRMQAKNIETGDLFTQIRHVLSQVQYESIG